MRYGYLHILLDLDVLTSVLILNVQEQIGNPSKNIISLLKRCLLNILIVNLSSNRRVNAKFLFKMIILIIFFLDKCLFLRPYCFFI